MGFWGMAAQAALFPAQGACSAHGTAASLFLSPLLNVTLVQVTCLPSYQGWGLGGAKTPEWALEVLNLESFPPSSNVYWMSPTNRQ